MKLVLKTICRGGTEEHKSGLYVRLMRLRGGMSTVKFIN